MTLTTEQLRANMIEKIAVASGLRARDGRNVVAEAIYAEVVEPLLANREAVPVADPDYIRRDCGCCGFESLNYFQDSAACPMCNHTPMGKTELYTAPPAPAVPDEIGFQEAKELFNYLMTEEELNATVNGYNACRAEMLAAAPEKN